MRQVLSAVTYAKKRLFAFYIRQVYHRGVFLPYRIRAAAKYHGIVGRGVWRIVKRMYFAIYIELTHAARYQLRILRTEIENKYFVLHLNFFVSLV